MIDASKYTAHKSPGKFEGESPATEYFYERMQPTLKVGTLAYWDTPAGLVPCKVIAIEAAIGGAPGYQATFKVTAARKPYYRGEIHTRMTRNVVPRRAVRFRKLGARILPYTITV